MGGGRGGEAGHPSEGAMGMGGTTSGGKKAPGRPGDAPKEKPRNALEGASVCLRMYPSEVKDFAKVLETKLAKLKNATGVHIDTNANWVTLTYTSKNWDDVKELERASDGCGVPARVISPATIEFNLGAAKGGPKQDKKKFEEALGKTSLFDYELGATLKVQTSLLATNWSGLFADAADCGYALTPKSHVFHKVAVKNGKGEEPSLEQLSKTLYAQKGVLLIGQAPDQKGRFGIITTSEVPEKDLMKLLTDFGYAAETFE